jgi:hypothetical protein
LIRKGFGFAENHASVGGGPKLPKNEAIAQKSGNFLNKLI